MKHLAIIQSQFLKIARDWDELSRDEQQEYLKRHPGSKRRLTAKPESSTSKENLTQRIQTLNQLSTDEIKQHANKLSDKLSEKEIKAIHSYCQFGYERINSYLRSHPDYIKKDISYTSPDWNSSQNDINELDNIFEKVDPINKDITLTRKVTSISYIPKKKNETFTEPAYMSTTFSPDSSFKLPMKSSKEYNVSIRVPKGAKPIFVYGKLAPYRLPRIPDFATKHPGEEEPRITSEKEAILPRNSKFKFINKDGNNITLELVNEQSN
jgi:hypothetical protein